MPAQRGSRRGGEDTGPGRQQLAHVGQLLKAGVWCCGGVKGFGGRLGGAHLDPPVIVALFTYGGVFGASKV